MMLTFEQARAALREAVVRVGGVDAFAALHPLFTVDHVKFWIDPKGGMPSIRAFEAAGVHVTQERRANGKMATVYEME